MKILKRTTVTQWFDEWIEVYKSRTVKRGTLDTYRALYRARIEPEIGQMRLSSVDEGVLQRVLNSLADRGYSRSTVELARALLSGMFGQAVKCGEIKRNPCDGLVMPRNCMDRTSKVRALSCEETALLLKCSQSSPIEGMIQLALMTGMRGGELMALCWEDVDFNAGLIHVRHTLKQAKGRRWILDEPKTFSSLRDVPLAPQAASLLEKLASAWQKNGGMACRMGAAPEPAFVFSIDGEPVVKGQLQAELAKIRGRMLAELAASGVPDVSGQNHPCSIPDPGNSAAQAYLSRFTFHCLRHTFATRCIESGMSPKVLQSILGHSSLGITMDIYVSVCDMEKKKQLLMVAAAW